MCYKHDVVYSKDSWLFKDLAWRSKEGFLAINFEEYFKSTREKFYFKLSEGRNLRKVAKSLNLMQSNSSDNCVHRYNIEILNLSNPELQLINTKPMIKNKLK